MPRNLLSEGRKWLASQRHDYAAEWVTYSRGSEVAVRVRALPGRTETEQGDAVVLVQSQIRDWIITAADFPRSLGTPEKGDRIEVRRSDGARLTFDVQAPASGLSEWSWHDAGHNSYRVHTRLIDHSR